MNTKCRRAFRKAISLVCLVCFVAVILFPAVLMLPGLSHLHQAGDIRVRISDDNSATGSGGDRQDSSNRNQGRGFAHDKCLACALLGSAAKQLKQYCSIASGATTGSINQSPQIVLSPLSAQFGYDSLIALKTQLNN